MRFRASVLIGKTRLVAARKAALVFFVLLGLATASLGHQTFAADGPVSATLTPAEITLTPNATIAVTLVIANAGSESATNLAVFPTPPDASITVAPASIGTTSTTIPAMSSVWLSYNVTRQIEGTGVNVIVPFVVSYLQSSTGDSGVVVASLKVTAAASLPVVDAKIQSNVTNINENRPGEAALVITNPREAVITISSIQVTAPNFVDVKLQCRSSKDDLKVSGGTTAVFNVTRCPLTVDPRSEQVMHMSFTTIDTVAPGPRTVVVVVTATDSDTKASASSVATLGLTVDVFAESDVLKSLGVPIFLLLPGFVVVVIIQALLSFVGPKNYITGTTSETGFGKVASVVLAKSGDAKPPSSEEAKPPANPITTAASTVSLWLIASLVFSLVIARAYPWLTLHGPPFHARDYVVAYGFRDFYFAIGYGLAIGISLWALLALLRPVDRWFDKRLREWWKKLWVTKLVAKVAIGLGVSEETFGRWRRQYGGIE